MPSVLRECTACKELNYRGSWDLVMTGKSKKYSMGHSSAYVPIYRHSVESIDELEGLGISDPVKLQNNIQMRVFSLSKMTAQERKVLGMKLRSELLQVLALRREIELKALGTTGAFVSPSSNGRVKKQYPMKKIDTQVKRGVKGRFESLKPPRPPLPARNSDTVLFKQCDQLLKKLLTHKHAWVFDAPVDPEKLHIPDYFAVIQRPMDLGTIKGKLESGSYPSPWGFSADVRLTFTNALTYNPPGDIVNTMADDMSKFFEAKWSPIAKKLVAAEPLARQVTEPAKIILQSTSPPLVQSEKREDPPLSPNITVSEREKKKMTKEERQRITSRLRKDGLPPHVLNFLKGEDALSEESNGDMGVGFSFINDDTFMFKLGRLFDDHFRQAKAEPSKGEDLKESGLRNSNGPPCEDNEPIEEDVDICGDGSPFSNRPRKASGSQNSCSSSDSDSSSSDSDSDSSSDSESESDSDDDRVPSPRKTANGIVRQEAVINHKKSNAMNSVGINRTVSGLDQSKYAVCNKPASVDPQDGENAPSIKQVSGEKLKTSGTTLVQTEQPRRMTEEHGRQQQEEVEKSRLEVEAKAAEEASKQAKAEEEAADEAKRKLQHDREAARQALLKMEKTVDINGNLQMLADISLGRVPNSVDDHSQDDIGRFKHGGSNPLELSLLLLYIFGY